MRISGIAVVSSIAIPEAVSLSSFQFQVSHNTSSTQSNTAQLTQLIADTVNTFKNRLDKFWSNQDVLYDYTADLHGIGNRSIV